MPTIPEMLAKGWGDPTSPDYAKNNIVAIEYKNRTFRVNRRVKPLFHGLLLLMERNGVDITTGALDDWSYVLRPIRGYEDVVPTPYSYHSWGLAIDLDSIKNPLGATTTSFPVTLTKKAATDCSLDWGYLWSGRKDPQHFEFNDPATSVKAALAHLKETRPRIYEKVT